jgi:protein tyrosine/serine phosphatase
VKIYSLAEFVEERRRRDHGRLNPIFRQVAIMKQRSLARAASIAILTLVLGLPLAARGSGALEYVEIGNFGQVSDTYYRGAQPEGADYAALAKLGVKTVIDLQADGLTREAGLVTAAGMTYVRIPMTTRVAPTEQQVAEFLAIVNDPAQQPVYVHCAGGRHRTGVMTAVYRMTQERWTGEQAFKEMKKYDYGPDFLHPEFKEFVYRYRRPEMVAADGGADLRGRPIWSSALEQ